VTVPDGLRHDLLGLHNKYESQSRNTALNKGAQSGYFFALCRLQELLAKHDIRERPALSVTSDLINDLSEWIDAGNAGRDPEAATWGRVAKVSEEAGEAIAALVGATGQNPRKGVVGSLYEVQEELLDVAITALAAVAHLQEERIDVLDLLRHKVLQVANRAGLVQ
jgi:hypothetical protein